MTMRADRILLVERAEEPDIIKAVVIDVDPEDGARLVTAIVELERGPRAAEVIIRCVGNDWVFDRKQAARTNFGRAHSLRGMLQRMIEQV